MAFAFVCALARMGSIFVAFITLPLTFSLPPMNKLWAFVFPDTSLPKSSSDKLNVTSAFLPAGASPLATVPDSLRSICQADSWPALFFSLKAKTALPFLIASFLSSWEDSNDSLIASKAIEEGNAAVDRC